MHSSILAPVGRSDASYSLEFECYYKLKTLTMRARIEWRPGISIDAVFSARARSTRRGQFEACMVVLAPPPVVVVPSSPARPAASEEQQQQQPQSESAPPVATSSTDEID